MAMAEQDFGWLVCMNELFNYCVCVAERECNLFKKKLHRQTE